jgi:hypothetical protein
MTRTPDEINAEFTEIFAMEAENPRALYNHVRYCIYDLQRDALINFSAGKDGLQIDAVLQGQGIEIPPILKEKLERLAPYLVRCEIPSFDGDYHASGRIMITRGETPFLDAEDFVDDWDFQRHIELDELNEIEFAQEASASDAPEPQ